MPVYYYYYFITIIFLYRRTIVTSEAAAEEVKSHQSLSVIMSQVKHASFKDRFLKSCDERTKGNVSAIVH